MSSWFLPRPSLPVAALVAAFLAALPSPAADRPAWVRSARSGPWSAAATWEGGKVPAAGARVHVRAGHTITYDVHSDRAVRALHIAGILRFAADRDTRLDVG